MTARTQTRTLAYAAALMALVFALLSACAPTATRKSAGEQIDDAAITTKVKAALAESEATKARQIDVEVFRGRVQLNGFVDDAAQVAEAGRLARGVDGVVAVDNNLRVQQQERTAGEVVDDATLTARVKAALAEDSRTKARQINIETREGVVQLAGFVDDATARTAAADVARSVEGVRRVDNQLQVK